MYLETNRAGSGRDFDGEVVAIIERLADNPMQLSWLEPGVRRALIRRFGYVLLFEVRKDGVRISAVIHGSRDLRDWRSIR